MRLVSRNVNGIRAVMKKGFLSSLDALNTDVLCLQETKAQDDQVSEALKELEIQFQAIDEPVTHIVFASSSGGTQAGLMLGKKMLGASYQIVGINIDKGEIANVSFDQHILSLANSTAKFMGVKHAFSKQDLILNSDYVGEGYGVFGDLEHEAISLTAQTEGILLDPVYTGRAMGGLFDMIRSGKINKKDSVLFWHTGGVPALFAYPNIVTASKC